MKIKRFLLLPTIFAALLALFACSDSEYDSLENDIVNQGDTPKDYSFLGVGYDVIKSGYINSSDAKISFPVLDNEKMLEDAIIGNSAMNMQRYETFAGSSLKQFYQERNAGINAGADFSGITAFLFSGKYRNEFAAIESEDKSAYYSRVRSYRYTQDNYIKNPTPQNLSKYLTEFFISDLETMNAQSLLDRYGTHIFIRYYKGGSLEANYTYTGTQLTSNEQVKKAAEASFFVFSGRNNSSNTIERTELEENMSFKYYTYGGKSLSSTSMQQLMKDYGYWANSITDNVDICGIPDDFTQAFIPLWELANAVNSSKAEALKTEFKNRARDQGINLPGARMFKTADYINLTTSGDVSLQPPTGGTLAEIEIYALGAGGGGQGGNFRIWSGIGGSGGGGSAAYLKLGNNNLKLEKNESVSLNITIGIGGKGGEQNGVSLNSGCNGENGGATTVIWNAKGITLNVLGGLGGNSGFADCKVGSGVASYVRGGVGGAEGTVNPVNSLLYVDESFVAGSSGSNGNINLNPTDNIDPLASNGGNAAVINKGTLPSFGGGLGSIRLAKSTYRSEAQNGGGGTSGHMNEIGLKGGNGLVTIVYKYYIEE
jgi:hypothetical protein